MNNKFRERLVKALADKNISQLELSKMIGMSQSVVNNWCTGKREPSLNALCAICKALGESAGFLIGTEDN